MTVWVPPLVAVHQIRTAVLGELQVWLPTALAEVAAETGVDVPPSPRSWHRLGTWDQVAEAQLPVVFVAVPATSGTTVRRAEAYDAVWDLQVVAAVRGGSYEQTAEAVSVYAAAIRAVLTQRPVGWTCRWTGEMYDAMPARGQRTLAATMVTWTVEVADAIGLESPMRHASGPPDGPPTVPTVQETDVEVVVDESP